MINALKLAPLFMFFWTIALSSAAQQGLASGPMLGYSTAREVAVWLQLTDSSEVSLEYWPVTEPSNIKRTSTVKPAAKDRYTLTITASDLLPGTRYAYKIFLGNHQVAEVKERYFETQANWIMSAELPNFSFAVGSCAFINDPSVDKPGIQYGSPVDIFDRIADQQPAFMLWLGDNLYLRQSDWTSRTGIFTRYEHYRRAPGLQDLLSSTHHYAIWDDHDYGPNDSNRNFALKNTSLEAFKAFWANPSYGLAGTGGITSSFSHLDADFFLLDNRWYRTDPNLATGEEQVFGEAQIDWLIESLKYSKAPFKFVATGGQILNDLKVYETYANYEAEREMLLSRIVDEGIKGVVFLTGDRHHTELSRYEKNGIVLYDLTVSPLTSGAHTGVSENNSYRVDGTLVDTQNFAIITQRGTWGQRSLQIDVFDSAGAPLWQQIIDPIN